MNYQVITKSDLDNLFLWNYMLVKINDNEFKLFNYDLPLHT